VLKVFLGATLAFTRVDFTNAAGELVAFGRMWSVVYHRVLRLIESNQTIQNILLKPLRIL
jgi:hypothetical protein